MAGICSAGPQSSASPRPLTAGVAIEDGDARDAEGVGFGEERDMRPTPLRRHKRWDELPGGSGSSGGNGGGGRGGPGGEDGAEEWEQRRRQARVDAVVKKLQSNGAQVGLRAARGCCTGNRL